jgi:hypothetical protein
LTGSTRNGVTSAAWSAPDYASFPQPYSVIAAAVTLTVPTLAPATLTEPRLVTTTAVNPAIVAATTSTATSSPQVVTEARPTDRQPTILSDGPAPTGLTVSGTPTTATVQWLPVTGATGYRVNRALVGTTQWTAVTPAPIPETTSPTDELTDWRQTYTYQVLAYQADGSFGVATIDYVPAKPQDPSRLAMSASFATSAVISWQPVEGVWEYLVSGPGLTPSAQTSNTSFTVIPPRPSTSGVYQVASIYRPGGVLTPQSAWPSVTVSLTRPITTFMRPGTTTGTAPTSPTSNTGATCACTRTGAFRSPSLRTVDADGLQGGFSHPTAGSFTVDARSVAASVMLNVTDSQNRVVLSVDKPAGWGLSPDNRYFAVSGTPQSTNGPSSLVVYRVAAGPGIWGGVISTQIDADGRWAFSAGGKMFLVTRIQNAPPRFSFRAYNLEARDPNAAMVQASENGVSGASLTTSPCDDRLMYFRWRRTNTSLDGYATFYDRVAFTPNASGTNTTWDRESQSTPTASIVTGASGSPFDVLLDGLTLDGGTATSFPSLQCAP